MRRLTPDEMIVGLMAAKTVAAAIELNVVDLLAERSQTAEQLAERARLHAPSLRRLLRTLTGLGFVAETTPGHFELTPSAASLLAGVPGSRRHLMLARCAPEFWHSWAELVPSVRSGQTAWELAHGLSWLDYYERHPQQWAAFNSHMSRHTSDAAAAIAAAGDFARFRTVVDVGGGDGTLMAQILRRRPTLNGVVFDLPEVVASAPATLAAAGVADRGHGVPGDFFASVPGGADAYLLKFIVHDWDDERAATILRNCRNAMARDGRVIVVERVLPERVGPADVPDLLSDILMLVATGGRERTEPEFGDLFRAADLNLTSISEPLPPFGYRLIEASDAAR